MRVFVPELTKANSIVDVIDVGVPAGQIIPSSSSRRAIHWDLQDAARNISWIRGSLTAVGKNIIGPGFKFVKVKEFEGEATERKLKELKRFYGLGVAREKTNIKDFYSTLSKFFVTAFALQLGGHAAWELRNDELFGDTPVTFDYVPGYVEPQINVDGTFKSPAWKQFLTASESPAATWDKPDDLVIFATPDFGGHPWSSDLEALVAYTLPSELYAMKSYLSIHKNRNSPYDGFWIIDPNVSDEQWKATIKMISNQYKGSQNEGKNPIVGKGQLDWKPFSRNKEDAPWLQGRNYSRQEISGVTHVPGSKLGVTEDATLASSREFKREYHETVVEPIHAILEDATYEQIHVAKLGIRGWKIQFNNPAFVNELEQASIDRTYWNIGKVSANELRQRDGQEPREGGDEYFEPTNMVTEEDRATGTVGARPNEPTENPGENNPAGQKPRPVRADEEGLGAEIRRWRKVELSRAKEGKKRKRFESEIIPEEVYSILNNALEKTGGDIDRIREIFDIALQEIA